MNLIIEEFVNQLMDYQFLFLVVTKSLSVTAGATAWTRTAVPEHKTEETEKWLGACVFLLVFLVAIT